MFIAPDPHEQPDKTHEDTEADALRQQLDCGQFKGSCMTTRLHTGIYSSQELFT